MDACDALLNPLAWPTGRQLLNQFRQSCGIGDEGDVTQQLAQLTRAFAAVPYENLTKILKFTACRVPEAARRGPAEVVHDFQCWGAGGTCFALTASLLHLVRALPLRAEPILADRRYGANTHCALVVWIAGQSYLLDPGYLIVDPLPLHPAAATRVVPTRFNQLELVPSGHEQLALHTTQQATRRYRLTFKTTPVDDATFLQAWDASFSWESMRYPVLTRVTEHEQRYLQGNRLQKRTHTDIQREEIPGPQLASRIVREFQISQEIVQRALDILQAARP